MIERRLEEVEELDLDCLLSDSVTEGKTVEYKKVLPGSSDSDKKEFLADVSSFANTGGGDLIFGVEETQGTPVAIPGLALSDPDMEVRRLDSMINDGLEPRVRFATRVIQRSGKLPVMVVRIERSWIGPHRVVFKGHDKFYARNSAGKYPMDVSELRSAFTLSGSVAERVRQFRADRIAKLHNNETPVSLVSGRSRTILHVLPLESFSGPVQYDVLKFSRQVGRVPPMSPGTGWGSRINLDGLVVFSGDASMSYTQLFRNGAIEAVEAYYLNVIGPRGERTIPHIAVEQDVVGYLKTLFEIQRDLGVRPPIVVALTLTETRGLRMATDVVPFDRGYQIMEENLVLPETVVESFDEPAGKILKPIFDLIWNACGYAKSKNFDDSGNWIGRTF